MTEAERAVTDDTIIIEVAGKNFSAYAPDVPGCVATGDTINETRRLMHEALTYTWTCCARWASRYQRLAPRPQSSRLRASRAT